MMMMIMMMMMMIIIITTRDKRPIDTSKEQLRFFWYPIPKHPGLDKLWQSASGLSFASGTYLSHGPALVKSINFERKGGVTPQPGPSCKK